MSTPTPTSTSTTTTTTTEPKLTAPSPSTLPITTHHCRFCATLLIATTRDLSRLPTRQKNAADSARILPLRNHTFPSSTTTSTQNPEDAQAQTESQEPNGRQEHYTILLSTNARDRKPTLIRREDGFEKRFFLRCGRCRVTVGYFLDEVHFPAEGGLKALGSGLNEAGEKIREGDEGQSGEDRAVYLLPGALMETGIMSDEEKMKSVDREWADWFK
ncbi:hypothetical protein ASPVEDRAFT_155025 [Aspergillus versicolor CBS 583.65]|uniref:STEEP1 domain-containing protein n=1 Tax=Aspergillus versicolor CBS 583.65 TaxID=1036611 RepID=A0A1L9Q060_ASPVE|nr:uncharacterized protein ASPVEDRAFT_155025 [Aspergillus versicolor CBS 583.65]OJJ07115.1 hypothetical protein ASPVEDRAFT_155025 [Aspergillus versicolor CBS 583.65]